MAVDGQDGVARALTVKSALSKQSSTRSRTPKRRGMISSTADQKTMSTFSAGTIPIALSLSNLPPSPSTTTTTDPGPSVAATGSSRSRGKNEDDNDNNTGVYTLPTTTYNKLATAKKAPPPSQYSPSVYNGGDDWQQLTSPPPKLPALPILAATTYSPRERTSPTAARRGKSKGAAPIPTSTTTSRRKSFKQSLDRQPKLLVSRDPREDKPLPARPNPTRLKEKKAMDEFLQVPISPASPSKAPTSTRMIKVKTKTVARKYPQLVETSSSSNEKMSNLARTKSKITRIMSFGGGGNGATPVGGDDTSSPSGGGGGGGGGWWDMLDSIIPAPLKAPPRNPVVPPATKGEMKVVEEGKGGFDPGNVF